MMISRNQFKPRRGNLLVASKAALCIQSPVGAPLRGFDGVEMIDSTRLILLIFK
jgi:hypothetical protein